MKIQEQHLGFFFNTELFFIEEETGLKCNISEYYKNINNSDYRYFKPIVKSISNIKEDEMQQLYNEFGDMMILSDASHLSDIILIDCEGNYDTLPLRVCRKLAEYGYDIFNWLDFNLGVEPHCA